MRRFGHGRVTRGPRAKYGKYAAFEGHAPLMSTSLCQANHDLPLDQTVETWVMELLNETSHFLEFCELGRKIYHFPYSFVHDVLILVASCFALSSQSTCRCASESAYRHSSQSTCRIVYIQSPRVMRVGARKGEDFQQPTSEWTGNRDLRYADSGAFSLYIQVTGDTTPQVVHCRRAVILDLVGD